MRLDKAFYMQILNNDSEAVIRDVNIDLLEVRDQGQSLL